MTEHVTEVGLDHLAQLASASCSCGWANVISYARQTGEPVAVRLARVKARIHERDVIDD